jgi:pyruvate dehydrogenase E1 component
VFYWVEVIEHLSECWNVNCSGIAENNLFLMLTAAGLTANLFGQRILPIGTLYDPFIARGLDALTYGCYQNSRFMVVSTPSGVTLSPEGGAHQSINSPLIGMSQPGLVYLEPSYIDELQVMMSWGLRHMQATDGGSVYLRLSTRMLEQPTRVMTPALREDIIRGAYFHTELSDATLPSPGTRVCLAFVGAVAPEAIAACNELSARLGRESVSLLQITSADALYDDYHNHGDSGNSHIQRLLEDLPRECVVVTVMDGSPATLSWLGAVRGHKCRSHGVTQFGQCGDVTDLYKHFNLDTDSLVQSAMKYCH